MDDSKAKEVVTPGKGEVVKAKDRSEERLKRLEFAKAVLDGGNFKLAIQEFSAISEVSVSHLVSAASCSSCPRDCYVG